MEIKVLFPRLHFTRDLWTIIVIAIILTITGAGLLYISAIGIAESMKYGFLSQNLNYPYPAYMLVAAGITFLLTGLIGVIAVARDSKPLFALSLSCYLLIILLLMAAGALSHTLRREILKEFDGRLLHGMIMYKPEVGKVNGNQAVKPTIEMDQVQMEYQCCGKDNFTDWVRYNEAFIAKNADGTLGPNGERNSGFLPDTCCWGKEKCQTKVLTKDSTETDAYVFKRGCLNPLTANTRKYLANMCAVATVYLFAVIVIIMGMSIIMCKNSNRSFYLPVKPSILT